jgi:hypothetical protein
MADKNMSIIPVAFSLMASFMSAVTLLGVSMENYSYGTQFVMINISYGIATPIAAYGYLPVFYELQATSAYEVIRQYFSFLTIYQNMIFLVFRKEVWQSNETMRLIGIFIPNDSIHGHSAIRACFSSLCSNWYFPAGFNPMHWPSLHFLLNHRWNEGSSCDRRFPGNYLISLS